MCIGLFPQMDASPAASSPGLTPTAYGCQCDTFTFFIFAYLTFLLGYWFTLTYKFFWYLFKNSSSDLIPLPGI